MAPRSGSVRCGDQRINPGELAAGVAATEDRRATPIIESNAALAITRALQVRTAGGLPVVGDDRWPLELRSQFIRELASTEVPADAAWGTFTSGSTGRPRTVLRTSESWSSSHSAVSALVGLRPDDVVYAPAPLVSSLSLFAAVHALAEGVDIRLPLGHSLAAHDLADSTVLHATPFALGQALDAIESGASHRLRVALIGGDRVTPSLRARAERAGVRVVSYYGAAELSFVTVDEGEGMRPFPGVELELREGVIWVRSPFVASGYLGPTSGPLLVDAAGWATVGDRATAADDGALVVGGREDGAILTAGATVVPADVEGALGELPGVRAVVVFGIEHPRAGAIVAAVVESAAAPALRPLRRHAAERLALAQQPRRWYWSPQLPRTTSGKLDRAAVAAAVDRGDVTRL